MFDFRLVMLKKRQITKRPSIILADVEPLQAIDDE